MPVAAPATAPDDSAAAIVSQPAAGERNGRSIGFGKSVRMGTALAVIASMLIAGTALADPPAPTCDDTNPTCQDLVEFFNGSQNDAGYWDTYFDNNGHPDYVCTKVEEQPYPVVLANDHDALVIKTGQWFYIWVPAPAGDYYAAQDSTSHYYTCDGDTVEDDIIDPTGSLGGPCADPAYYATFDNSASTVPVKFRFRWYNNYGLNAASKWVPGGQVFVTWQHWAKPGTKVSVWYKDPNTSQWVLIEKQTVVKGSYPACEYTPGWQNTQS